MRNFIDNQGPESRYGAKAIPHYLSNLRGACEREYRQDHHHGCEILKLETGPYVLVIPKRVEMLYRDRELPLSTFTGTFTSQGAAKEALDKAVLDDHEARETLESFDAELIEEYIAEVSEKYGLRQER